jgi:hypothetical protein
MEPQNFAAVRKVANWLLRHRPFLATAYLATISTHARHIGARQHTKMQHTLLRQKALQPACFAL